MIKDSGARTEFGSGAVRDIKAGVGRCDLLPLGEVAYILDDEIIRQIGTYQESGCIMCLKTLRGDTDEDHARAFLWNLICLMWQHRNA